MGSQRQWRKFSECATQIKVWRINMQKVNSILKMEAHLKFLPNTKERELQFKKVLCLFLFKIWNEKSTLVLSPLGKTSEKVVF